MTDQPALSDDLEPPPHHTAGELVKAWHRAYAASGRGRVDPTVTKRVAGSAKAIGKDRVDEYDWEVALIAAERAGVDGQYDITPYLVQAQRLRGQRERRNGVAAMLEASLEREALER